MRVAIARRGSKRITVADVEYRWAVSEDSGYKVIVVQHASGSGQRLEARTSVSVDYRQIAVRPGAVAKLIEAAIDEGWEPESSGPPFRLAEVDSFLDR